MGQAHNVPPRPGPGQITQISRDNGCSMVFDEYCPDITLYQFISQEEWAQAMQRLNALTKEHHWCSTKILAIVVLTCGMGFCPLVRQQHCVFKDAVQQGFNNSPEGQMVLSRGIQVIFFPGVHEKHAHIAGGILIQLPMVQQVQMQPAQYDMPSAVNVNMVQAPAEGEQAEVPGTVTVA